MDSIQNQIIPQKNTLKEFPRGDYSLPKPAVKVSYVAPTQDAKSFIYQKESGNNPLAINPSSGACGIGQALPCSKLTSVCQLSDYQCQDAFFTRYMQSRYGTWEKARTFWLSNHWW